MGACVIVLNSDLTQLDSDKVDYVTGDSFGGVFNDAGTDVTAYQVYASSISDAPGSSNRYNGLMWRNSSGTYGTQVAFTHTSDNLYIRRRNNSSSFTDWVNIATENDLSGFITTKSFNQDNVTVASNDSANLTFSVSNSGYTPIGVIGFQIANGSSSGQLSSYTFPFRCSLSGSTVYFSVRNTWSSDAAKLSITINVLYTKNI